MSRVRSVWEVDETGYLLFFDGWSYTQAGILAQPYANRVTIPEDGIEPVWWMTYDHRRLYPRTQGSVHAFRRGIWPQ